jgi:hypothetical protein
MPIQYLFNENTPDYKRLNHNLNQKDLGILPSMGEEEHSKDGD